MQCFYLEMQIEIFLRWLRAKLFQYIQQNKTSNQTYYKRLSAKFEILPEENDIGSYKF